MCAQEITVAKVRVRQLPWHALLLYDLPGRIRVNNQYSSSEEEFPCKKYKGGVRYQPHSSIID